MTGCDYDGAFYRVFCVTLLAIAFTFTVILTNVFVDIDGLLVSKERGKKHEHEKPNLQKTEQRTERVVFHPPTNLPEVTKDFDVEEKQDARNDLKTFEDENASYRTKRSLDSTNFQFHIKDPKIKNILTTKLATLLDDLDNENTDYNRLENATPKKTAVTLDPHKDTKHVNGKTIRNNKTNNAIKNDNQEKELLHLTMHNILLQDITRHMDLSDVHNKRYNSVQNLDLEEKKNLEKEKELQMLHEKSEEQKTADVQKMFLEELIKCAKLQEQIAEKINPKSAEKGPALKKVPNIVIKTVIDVTSLRNGKSKENDTNPKEIRGVIKFLYNGRPVKFTQADDQDGQENPETKKAQAKTIKQDVNKVLEAIEVSDFIKDHIRMPNSIINNAIVDYFSKNADITNLLKNPSTKRSKRSVKVRKAQMNHTTEKIKVNNKNLKNEDEELYVEIETHIDGKGTEGEKKRKLVKKIIEKIQNAINSDIKHMQVKRKPKKFNYKKRFQAPLDNRERILINKFLIPFDPVVKRELAPISKTYPATGEAPKVYDKSGETWKSIFFGPRFLSASKGINSAELGQVDVRYDKDHSGSILSPRMQKPLYAETVDDSLNKFYELGNLKFYIKDLDGSGFSIGFNQFVGEAPDDESINTFTGVDNLIKTYSTKYDEEEEKPMTLQRNVKLIEQDDRVSKEGDEDNASDNAIINKHKIKRRNVDEGKLDHHSNEYKIIFSNDFLPYDTYQEIIEDRHKKVSFSLQKEKPNITHKEIPSKIPYLIGKTIFNKELKPSEIFSLANLIDRKKRSIKVKKISKINIGNKLNKYVNSHKTVNKIFFQNKPRSGSRVKRSVEKIRIVATDNLGNVPLPRNSDENIFLVSDENIFTDHGMVKDVPEEAVDAIERPYEEFAVPEFAYEENKPHSYANVFSGKARHNILMSKYPHIFMEEISRSKEEERSAPENIFLKNYEQKNYYEPEKLEHHHHHKRIVYPSTENPDDVNNLQDIVEAISPRTNYKLTVKILPKNSSLGEGFKEIHTSINKSISKNGVIISSQVNVSEISRVEKINETTTVTVDPSLTTVPPIVKHIKKQQAKMNTMLIQHKQRIEEQLEDLNKERHNIDIFMGDKPNDLINVLLPSNPPQMMHLTKDEAGQLITSALLKLRDAPHLNDLGPRPIDHLRYNMQASSVYAPPLPLSLPQLLPSPPEQPHSIPQMSSSLPQIPSSLPQQRPSPPQSPSSSPQQRPSPQLLPLSSPPPPPLQPRLDLEKMGLINTILQNENITKAILTKIDTNTQMLQSFLQKLTYKFETEKHRKKTEDAYRSRSEKVMTESRDHITHKQNVQSPSNHEVDNRNETHVTIPFVYAYQQSFPMNSKANIPVASVVYQGHIHANTITNKDFTNFHPVSQAKLHLSNDTRFFIDELETDYKAPPINREYGASGKVTIFTGNLMPLRSPIRNSTNV